MVCMWNFFGICFFFLNFLKLLKSSVAGLLQLFCYLWLFFALYTMCCSWFFQTDRSLPSFQSHMWICTVRVNAGNTLSLSLPLYLNNYKEKAVTHAKHMSNIQLNPAGFKRSAHPQREPNSLLQRLHLTDVCYGQNHNRIWLNLIYQEL